MNLNYEFSLINVSEKLNVVAQDARERLFTVSAVTEKNVLILHVKFPPNYPNQKAPIFSFLQGTTVDNTTRNHILGRLRKIANSQITKNRRCLEPCLRQFESCLDQLTQTEEDQMKLNNPGQLFANKDELENREDEKIPYPRSSGARFCGDGQLVCFGRSRSYSVSMTGASDQKRISVVTPRALSAMSTPGVSLITSGATSPKYSVVGLSLCATSPSQDSGYLTYQTRVPRVRFSASKSRFSVTSVPLEDISNVERKISSKLSSSSRPVIGTVTVYSCQGLLPYTKDLAPLYKLPRQHHPPAEVLEEICLNNAKMAQQVERSDLVQIWNLLAMTASGYGLSAGPFEGPWSMNPFGSHMLEDIIRHYVRIRDVQTAATICAVFGNRYRPDTARHARKKNSKSESLKDTLSKESLNSLKKFSRTQSEHVEDTNLSWGISTEESVHPKSSVQLNMLSPNNNTLYDSYILAYADLLYRWKMYKARTELVKCLSSNSQSLMFAAKLTTTCDTCNQPVSGARCVYCHKVSIRCSICRLPCPGTAVTCPKCSHGGHPRHIQSWFSDHDQCATGCGCLCLKE